MSSVAIIQSMISDYRVAFYSKLHSRLAVEGCELALFASPPTSESGLKDGLGALPFAMEVRRFNLTENAYWHPLWSRPRNCDLVIVQQENGALLNYPLFLSRHAMRRPRLMAFWGHGTTLQGGGRRGIKRWFKNRMIGAADHWFAYTKMSSQILIEHGYPAERITTVNNSIDVSDISAAADRRRQIGRERFRESLRLGHGPIAVFCSRLYAEKKLNFLLASAKLTKATHPDFELVIIGDGPELSSIRSIAREESWIRPLGALYGRAKADQLAAADFMLLPAWVGLSILDGFAAGLPVIAADFDNHSPEIAYLQNGGNGFITETTPQSYSAAISALLSAPQLLARMSDAALDSANTYSLDAMVENFARGIFQTLDIDQAQR